MDVTGAVLTSVCRKCGAHLVWRHTSRGHVLALDADPHPDGVWVHTGRTVRNDLGVSRPEVAGFDPDQLVLFGVSDPERFRWHDCG